MPRGKQLTPKRKQFKKNGQHDAGCQVEIGNYYSLQSYIYTDGLPKYGSEDTLLPFTRSITIIHPDAPVGFEATVHVRLVRTS
jgi:hypothetical protein